MTKLRVGNDPPAYDDDDHFTIKMHYGGKLETRANTRTRKYVGGTMVYFDYVNAEYMSLLELNDMLKTLELGGVHKFYYKMPGRDLYHGLRFLITDSDCVEMVRWRKLRNPIEVYVEKESDGQEVMISDDSNGDGNGDDSESQSSEGSTELEDFVDSEVDEDEDDDLFDINVDKNIEWGGLSISKGKDIVDPIRSAQSNEEESDGEAQSDELVSLHGSDEEIGGPPRYPQFHRESDMADPKFKVGLVFPTKEVFKTAVKEHAIKTGKHLVFAKNDKDRVRVVCIPPVGQVFDQSQRKQKTTECGWVLLASKMQGKQSFQVRTYNPKHNCRRLFKNRRATSGWLAKKYVESIRSNPNWPVQAFQDQVQKDHKVGVSRGQLYKARKIALEMIQGAEIEQYRRLPDYMAELKRSNPGSTIIMKTNEDETGKDRFERLYLCYNACKQGFLAGCRPFIGLDGCHLKGPLKGQLLSAVGIDGNNQSFVVAFAVVEGENRSSWKWFLEILSEDLQLGLGQMFTFMSDKQKGLIGALGYVMPQAEHRFCIRHFYSNFKEANKGLHLKEILFAASKACYVGRFNYQMERMNEADPDAVKWLADHPPMFWSRSHFMTHSKCELVDNNMCESFNNTILDARGKTLIPMLEEIRMIMMRRFQQRREKMRGYDGQLCPNIRNRINIRCLASAETCIATWSGARMYQVNCFSGEQFTTDLSAHTCSCRRWDLTGIPCPHAIAAINYNHENVDDYVDHWFTKRTYMATYEPIIYPLNGADMWPVTGVIGPLPPDVKKQPGRPKKKRKRAVDEPLPESQTKFQRRNSTTTCAQCGGLGHNKRSCKGTQPPPEGQNAELEENHEMSNNPEQGSPAASEPARDRRTWCSQPPALREGSVGVQTTSRKQVQTRSRKQAQQMSTPTSQPIVTPTKLSPSKFLMRGGKKIFNISSYRGAKN